MAGIMSLGFAILSIYFHEAADAILAVIIGVFGIIKGDKLGKLLSVAGVVLGIIGFILFNPFQSHIPTSNGSVYLNTEYNFQITPPAGWIVDESQKAGRVVQFLDRAQSIQAVVGINTFSDSQIIKSNFNLYINNIIKGLQNTPDTSFISQNEIVSNGTTYYLLESKIKISSGSGTAHVLQLISLQKDGQAIIVTGESDESIWNNFSTVVKNSLLSFAYK